jgi:hypothetical protein
MDDTLLMLAYEVRGKTLWLLEEVITGEMAHFAAPGLVNSIVWHAGHVLVVIEHLAVAPATGQPPEIPADWFEKFSWDSQPRTVKDWPDIGQVIAALRRQLPRLTEAISTLSPEQLNQVVEIEHGSTLRYNMVHALHDEANHQGEIWLLSKMYAQLSP